jgi:hypothetical protein
MIEASEGFPTDEAMDERAGWYRLQHGDTALTEAEDDVPAYHRRRSAGTWVWLAVLTVSLGVAVAYGYSVLEQLGIQTDQIPGLTRSLPAFSQHMASLENRLVDSRAAEGMLAARLQSVDAESKAAILETRQETHRMASQVQLSLTRQIGVQSAALQAQMAKLATDRATDQARLAQMEDQVTAQQSALEAARADYARELATLRDQQSAQHQELASLRSSLPTQPVTFDIHKDQPFEIAPGVTFRLTKTDLGRQRFDGWIESAAQHQRVSVQSQSVRTPIVFFPSESGKALMLVVTQVQAGGASGYLMVPSAADLTGKLDVASATDDTAPGSAQPALARTDINVP